MDTNVPRAAGGVALGMSIASGFMGLVALGWLVTGWIPGAVALTAIVALTVATAHGLRRVLPWAWWSGVLLCCVMEAVLAIVLVATIVQTATPQPDGAEGPGLALPGLALFTVFPGWALIALLRTNTRGAYLAQRVTGDSVQGI